MKSIKAVPTVLSSASTYLRDVASRIGLKGSLEVSVTATTRVPKHEPRQRSSTPSSKLLSVDATSNHKPANQPSIITINQTIQQRSVVTETTTGDNNDDQRQNNFDTFESAMTDWMKKDDENDVTSTPIKAIVTKDNQSKDVQTTTTTTDMGSILSPFSTEDGSSDGHKDSSIIPKAVVTTDTSTSTRLTRSAAHSKARSLIKILSSETLSTMNQRLRLKELTKHLLNYPDACGSCIKSGAIPILLRLRERSEDKLLIGQSRQVLSLLGVADPPKGKGIRILSIDGGGIRGVVILEVLRKLQQLTNQPVHEMFDLICGVSTGAILTMLFGALKADIETCEQHYRMVSKNLFVSDFWGGTQRLIMTHAYYDAKKWEAILKQVYGDERLLIDTCKDADVPKVMAISSSVGSPNIKPFVFRNFNLPYHSFGYYEGSCKHKVWQAVRASSSAPGYFEEFVLDNHVHQDGGILINNPAAIAIHEASLLWPNESIQCLVSIGCGKYTPAFVGEPKNDGLGNAVAKVKGTSLRMKLTSLIESATDTEVVHRLLQDLLPAGTYYRMNPTLSEWMNLDENRPEKLDQLRTDTQMYVRKNEYKMSSAANCLNQKRSYLRTLVDNLKLQYDQM